MYLTLLVSSMAMQWACYSRWGAKVSSTTLFSMYLTILASSRTMQLVY